MNVALRTEHLNLISICTGGFGLDLGVELAIPSARTVCMVEREAFAVAQLVSAMEAGHMAPAPIWSDARTFNGRAWRGAVDGLIGGIPCQPHSLAGRKQGQNDERDLWSDARRIIVQSRAKLVLIENVSGMLSAGADEIAGAERVCRDLHKLGFSVEGGLFTASEVGAPHQRERVFILGVADPRCFSGAGRRNTGDMACPSRACEADSEEWERDGHSIGYGGGHVSGVGQADANSERLEGIGANAGEIRRPDARRSSRLCDRAALVHAERSERRAHTVGRHEPDRQDRGWDEAAGGIGEPSQLVDDASIARGGPISIQPRRQGKASAEVDRPSAGYGSLSDLQHLADANGDEQAAFGRNSGEMQSASQGESGTEYRSALSGRLSLPDFPPGPGDADGWREVLARAPELEPAFRRVADGLASKLDISRVDRLRMLGNGVVPLEAAYALRTLITRLAARGSASAARLVRMMEGTEA
ncbi:DNA cytosine methyltransferase [Agrobacterium tumefaciens]|nr:DNA cytosine methyltransferase [Agrobacterium tumefaciens]